MKNSSSQWKPLGESCKFRCQQQCLAKYRYRAVEKPTAILGNARQSTLVCWCRRKHRTKAWRSWTQTSSSLHHCKRDEFYDSLVSCSQIHSDASSIQNSRCKGSSGGIMGKLEKIPTWQLTRVRNKKDAIEKARDKGRLMDLCHLKNSELEPQCQKYTGRVALRGDIV